MTHEQRARGWLSAQNCEFGREPVQRHEAERSLAALLLDVAREERERCKKIREPLEARIRQLELGYDKLREAADRLKVRIAELEGQLDELGTTAEWYAGEMRMAHARAAELPSAEKKGK